MGEVLGCHFFRQQVPNAHRNYMTIKTNCHICFFLTKYSPSYKWFNLSIFLLQSPLSSPMSYPAVCVKFYQKLPDITINYSVSRAVAYLPRGLLSPFFSNFLHFYLCEGLSLLFFFFFYQEAYLNGFEF